MTVTAEAPTAPAEAPAEAKKSKKKLLIIVVVIALVGGVGYLKVVRKPPAPTKAVAGKILSLPSQTLNLSDGHVLQVGVALQLTTTAVLPSITAEEAKIDNLTLSVLSPYSYHALLRPATRSQAQHQLSDKVAHLLNTPPPTGKKSPPSVTERVADTQVLDTFFSSFLMQ